jgi:hypothetical protein
MATPNLALIPSAYKARVVYSVLHATRINKDGLIETVDSHVPRLNYDLYQGKPKQCPSLLLEPARTNLISDSIEISQFTKSNTTVVDNIAISPDGNMNASEVSEQNVNGVHYVGAGITGLGAGEYTWSCFLKKGTSRYGGMRAVVNGFTNRFFVNLDLENGNVVDTHTVGSGTTWEYYVDKYPNGWYRIIIQAANGTGNMDLTLSTADKAQPSYNLGLPTYQGNSNNNFYVWGAQFEAGSYATSFIKTTGSTETRNAEECNSAGNSSTFNDSEGVLMAEIYIDEDIDNNVNISVSKGLHVEDLIKFIYLPSTNEFGFEVFGGTVRTTANYNNLLLGMYNKVSGYYDSSNTKLYINGFEVSTTSTNQLPTGMDQLNFDRADGSAPFYGNTKQIQYFDSALTDSQLEYLTSYRSFGDMVESQNYIIQ